MTEIARQILDELMGPDRNKLPHERSVQGIRFYDFEVCKYHLVEFCPYQLFMNTKSDMGACPKRFHEDNLQEQYAKEGFEFRVEYEREFTAFLEKLVHDLERKLQKGRERLDVNLGDAVVGINPENDENEEKRTLLNLQIKEMLEKIEKYGEEGRVQEAQDLSLQVERLKAEIERLRQVEAEGPAFRLEKRMDVCQTCGAFLIIGDAQKRIDAHFEGRQHNGWARIRQTLEEMKKKYPSLPREEDRRSGRRMGSPPRRGRNVDAYTPSYDSRAPPPRDRRSSRDDHRGGGYGRGRNDSNGAPKDMRRPHDNDDMRRPRDDSRRSEVRETRDGFRGARDEHRASREDLRRPREEFPRGPPVSSAYRSSEDGHQARESSHTLAAPSISEDPYRYRRNSRSPPRYR